MAAVSLKTDNVLECLKLRKDELEKWLTKSKKNKNCPKLLEKIVDIEINHCNMLEESIKNAAPNDLNDVIGKAYWFICIDYKFASFKIKLLEGCVNNMICYSITNDYVVTYFEKVLMPLFHEPSHEISKEHFCHKIIQFKTIIIEYEPFANAYLSLIEDEITFEKCALEKYWGARKIWRKI